MRIYVSSDFYNAWVYTPPLIIGTCLLVIGTFFSVSYTVHKDSVGFLKSGAFSAGVNILLNLCLIPIMGAWGAAFATFVSYFIVFLYRYFDIKKYLILDLFNTKHMLSMGMLFLAGIISYTGQTINTVGCIIMMIATMCLYRKNWSEIVHKLIKKR